MAGLVQAASPELSGTPRDWWRGARLGVLLMCLGLAANIFSGHSDRLGLPISLDRIFIPLALVLILYDVKRPRVRAGLVGTLMLAFTAWTLISMAWYGNLLSTTHLFALLDRIAMPFILFLVAPVAFRTTARRDLLLKTLVLIGLYLGVTAVLETVAPQFVFPRYIVDQSVGLHYGRARGPFADAEGMALALAMCAGASFLLVSRNVRRWSGLALAVGALDLFAVVLATTRSVWVGTTAGIVVALVLSRGLRRFIPVLAATVVAGAIGVMLFLPSVLESVLQRTGSTLPIYDRLASNMAAARVLHDLPLTGIGWRRFYPYGSDWARQADLVPMNNAVVEVHNVLLSRGVELGLPALIVFVLIILLGPLRAALPIKVDPKQHDLAGWRVLCGYAVATWLVAGLFGPLANPFPSYVVWLMAGVASSVTVMPAREDNEQEHPAHVTSKDLSEPHEPLDTRRMEI